MDRKLTFMDKWCIKMGMYDDIKFEMDCPKCGKKVGGFQSKDGECLLNKLDFWEVDNFYTSCGKCKTWIEFYIKPSSRLKLTIDDYDMKLGHED